MKVLVLGGTGHTGERLVKSLVAESHEVHVLSRQEPASPLPGKLAKLGAVIHPGSAGQRWTVWRALDGCQAMISCAHIRYANVCIQACNQLDVRRYIQMSSTRGLSRFEKHPSVREVRLSEKAIRESNLDYTIIRPTMIYGGERDANIEILVQWFGKRRWFPLFGDGLALVQPIYVDDVITALKAALTNPVESTGRVFTIAGKAPLRYRAMIEGVCYAVRGERPYFIKFSGYPSFVLANILGRTQNAEMIERMAEDKNADYTEAAETLNFSPMSFGEGLRKKMMPEPIKKGPQ